MFRIIVDQSIAAIPQAQGAIVELLDADDLIYRAASGNARRYVGRRLPVAGSLAGRSIAAGTALIIADLETEPEIDLPRYRDLGMRALMAVPFQRDDQSFGAIKFYSNQPSAFAESDLAVARLIAGQLIGSLARIHEQVMIRQCREENARFQAISEAVPQMIWAMARSGEPVGYNRRASEILGLDGVKLAGGDMMSLFERQSADMRAQWEQARADLAPVSFECRLATPGDGPRWYQIDLAPIMVEGRAAADEWLGIGTDIDAIKTLEAALQDSIRSRELLFIEVNHRAKNSLQIISGLLAMHASKITHPEAKARLMDARAQIGTIAQVYEAIYQTIEQDRVEFVSFLRNLATSLIGGAEGSRAQLDFDVPDELMLPIHRGIPVALIAGEIITNAIKHASGRDDARITITIRCDDAECSVDIADNGPGLPSGFDPDRSPGLGMDIIFGLARQIGGKVSIDPDHEGARFCLWLPR